jgi:hypothetical protein
MGKPSNVTEKAPKKRQPARWPFDPMQPGDHEPVRAPEEVERIQKQTGMRGGRNRSPKGDRR